MNTLLLTLALVSQTPDADELSAGQFLRIMNGLHSGIQDVTFVYEGTVRQVDSSVQRSFQGLYSFRSDGATLVDVFSRPANDDAPDSRSIHAILNGSLETVRQVPDLGYLAQQNARPQSSKGGPGTLNMHKSPERILYLWYFQTLEDPEHYGYEFQGWEKVDGHVCAKVQLYRSPKDVALNSKNPSLVRFWVDLQRGGHPLKAEFSRGPTLRIRNEIQLGRVRVSSEESIWFPIRGVTETFDDGKLSFRETYAVVDGSLRLNQGLDDSDFTVSIAQNKRLPDVGGLRQRQEQLEEQWEEAKRIPPPRTDPEGVKERLDKQLAEAERQAKQLEASSAARQRWGTTSVAQISLVLFGAVLLIGSVYWKWSMSR